MSDIWSVYQPDETGLKMLIIEDDETGTVLSTTVANPSVRVAAHRAWSGARQSRSPLTAWEIMREVSSQDADNRLQAVFHNYGHASIGDMARLQVDFTGVPLHFALALFNLSAVNTGQEKSTRYQQLDNTRTFPIHRITQYLPSLPEQEILILNLGYQSLISKLTFLSGKFEAVLGGHPEIPGVFASYYQIDWNDKHQVRVLQSRVLDCTRIFHPFGRTTGFTFETSARDWNRIIAALKASPILYYHLVGHHIERLLVPDHEKEKDFTFLAEAPGLLRHTTADMTTNQNLARLRVFLERATDFHSTVPIRQKYPAYHVQTVQYNHYCSSTMELVIAAYIKLLYPGANHREITTWLMQRDKDVKRYISALLFHGHTHHYELPLFARMATDSLFFCCSLGEVRDLNRHRGFGRFLPLPLVYGESLRVETFRQILGYGYTLPAYFELAVFAEEKRILCSELNNYYQYLLRYIERVEDRYKDSIDYTFALNLLPLAHRMEFWMHGDPKQLHYFTQLRSRPGGHMNYRLLAYEISEQIAKKEPYLAALRLEKRPDPASREEFLDRG